MHKDHTLALSFIELNAHTQKLRKPWTCEESHVNHNHLTVDTLTFYFPFLFLSLLKTLVSLAMGGRGEIKWNPITFFQTAAGM